MRVELEEKEAFYVVNLEQDGSTVSVPISKAQGFASAALAFRSLSDGCVKAQKAKDSIS